MQEHPNEFVDYLLKDCMMQGDGRLMHLQKVYDQEKSRQEVMSSAGSSAIPPLNPSTLGEVCYRLATNFYFGTSGQPPEVITDHLERAIRLYRQIPESTEHYKKALTKIEVAKTLVKRYAEEQCPDSEIRMKCC